MSDDENSGTAKNIIDTIIDTAMDTTIDEQVEKHFCDNEIIVTPSDTVRGNPQIFCRQSDVFTTCKRVSSLYFRWWKSLVQWFSLHQSKGVRREVVSTT